MTTVVGVDSSTQSCKLVLVDVESGQQIRGVSVPHPDGTAVDPQAWTRALERGFADLDLQSAERPIGIGVAGQQHGMVALDAGGEPVHEALLWNDTRSAPEAREMLSILGPDEWIRRTGSVPLPSFTITKLAWLARNHPELAHRTASVLLPHDYLGLALTGEMATDRSEASGTGYFSAVDNVYDEDLLERFFGHVPQLPRVTEPSGQTGTVTADWADGELAGIPVSAGMGDNAGAAFGLSLRPGQAIVSVGTSGTVFAPTPEPVHSAGVDGFADAAGGYLPLIATLNASRVLARTAHVLGVDLDAFSHLAMAAAPDADGLTLLPYFDGERTPNLPHASGSLHGLTRANFTPENVARAAVLGVLNSLRDGLDAVRGAGVDIDSVVLIGGGAKSPALRCAAAEVFGTEVVVPESAEYVALGAARQAVWAATGSLPDFAATAEERYTPTGDDGIAAYRERYVGARRSTHGV